MQSDMNSGRSIVVVGAGVIGLTCATVLAERGYSVSIVSRDLPDDSYSQAFASPWAGANFLPFSSDPRHVRWESHTYKKMMELAPTGRSMPLPSRIFFANDSDYEDKKWVEDVLPSYRVLEGSEVTRGSTGIAFTSFSVSAPDYIAHLGRRLKAQGVPIKRKFLQSIDEAFDNGASIVVNATGLGAKSLRGVEDAKVEPIRGQTVLVRAPQVKECSVDASVPGQHTYIIPRPTGDVILGGCFGEGEWDLSVDFKLARQILERCYALDPRLSHNQGPDQIKVISHNVGLRPSRRDGVRLEAEKIQISSESSAGGASKLIPGRNSREGTVVHAYGIGPAGFQASYGMAMDVANIIDRLQLHHFSQSKI